MLFQRSHLRCCGLCATVLWCIANVFLLPCLSQRHVLEERCHAMEGLLADEQKRNEANVARLEHEHAKQIKELTAQIERADIESMNKQATYVPSSRCVTVSVSTPCRIESNAISFRCISHPVVWLDVARFRMALDSRSSLRRSARKQTKRSTPVCRNLKRR